MTPDILSRIDKQDQLRELLDLSFEFLLSPSKNVPESIKLSAAFGKSETEVAVKQLASIIRLYCLRDLTEEEIVAKFSHLTPELQSLAMSTVKGRREEVLAAQIEDVNARSAPYMTSFDWDLRWVLGNNSLSSYRSQIANLVLNCRHPDGQLKPLQVELKRADVDKLIDLLESHVASSKGGF